MNIKLTKKEVLGNFQNVICVGYCDLWYLLQYAEKIGHTERAEGWGADIYRVNNETVIVTGYEPFGNINPNRAITKHYEEKATRLYRETSRETIRKKLNKLLQKYVDEVLESEAK